MRVFSAIPLPQDVKDKFSSITARKLPVTYINTTNLHITLNFFNELTETEVGFAQEAFVKIAANKQKFNIEFESLVKFGNQIHMKVKLTAQLKLFQNLLEKSFKSLGYNFQDRDYYPHVKLANLHMDKIVNKKIKLENFPNHELEQLNFEADKVILYESKLLLHHPHYIPLVEVNLI